MSRVLLQPKSSMIVSRRKKQFGSITFFPHPSTCDQINNPSFAGFLHIFIEKLRTQFFVFDETEETAEPL